MKYKINCLKKTDLFRVSFAFFFCSLSYISARSKDDMNDFSNSIKFDDLLVITPNPPTAAHYIFIYTIVHCSGKEKNERKKRTAKNGS